MRAGNYVEETTTSIAGTLGDGAVTLTQITNTPRFSTVFGTQATTCRYVIEDTVNKKFETGIGSVSSDVLTRTQPQVTWTGSTYTDNGATAIQFGSSPTSGDVKIRMSPTGEVTYPSVPAIQSTVAGDSWRDYPFSAHIVSYGNGGGFAVTANREYYSAYLLSRGGVLSGAQMEVTAGSAGNMKWALFACGSTGVPTNKIVDFTTITTMSAAAIKTDTATGSWSPTGKVRLTPGWYFIAQIFDSTPSVRGEGHLNRLSHVTPFGRKDGYGYGNTAYVGGSYASGFATPSLSGGTMVSPGLANSGFWLGLKVDVT